MTSFTQPNWVGRVVHDRSIPSALLGVTWDARVIEINTKAARAKAMIILTKQQTEGDSTHAWLWLKKSGVQAGDALRIRPVEGVDPMTFDADRTNPPLPPVVDLMVEILGRA